NTRELAEDFPTNQVIKQVASGKTDLPRDPTKRAVYEAQLQRYQDKRDRKEEASKAQEDAAPGADDEMSMSADARGEHSLTSRRQKIRELLNLTPDRRLQEILQMSPSEQLALLPDINGQRADTLAEGMTPQQRETLMSLKNPERVVVGELMQAKLLRAIYSERQFHELMTDFWFNHFNVFINKGADRILLTSYERDVIRPHALGKFEDLLVATARSPAMLFYLDNWLSVGPDSEAGLGITPPRQRKGHNRPAQSGPLKIKAKATSGLNENYGREL